MLTPADALALASGPGMDAAGCRAVLDLLMAQTPTPEQGADILVAWQRRGPTGVELAATVEALLARAVQVPITTPVLDLCGTGGSGRTRFNVSTTCAFILAAAGIPVAKHGNRGSARPNGSFDLLDALGVPYQLPPERLAEVFARSGLCFLFARAMHPAVAAVAPFRKLAAARVPRTIFNLAGPLANPCRPQWQVIGTVDQPTARVVLEAAQILGARRTLVVTGHPGIDEVSISGPTHVSEIDRGAIRHQIVQTGRHGLDHDALPGGDAVENAKLFLALLDGREAGPLAELVAVNAGAAIDCHAGRPFSADGEGARLARTLLATGAVREAYDRHRAALGA
jgi:anthranilate phosphoribosyltransferase